MPPAHFTTSSSGESSGIKSFTTTTTAISFSRDWQITFGYQDTMLCLGPDTKPRSFAVKNRSNTDCHYHETIADRTCGLFQPPAPPIWSSVSKPLQIDSLPGRALLARAGNDQDRAGKEIKSYATGSQHCGAPGGKDRQGRAISADR